MALIPDSWENISLKRQSSESAPARDCSAKRRRKRATISANDDAEQDDDCVPGPAIGTQMALNENSVSKQMLVDKHTKTNKNAVIEKLTSSIKVTLEDQSREQKIEKVLEKVNMNLEKIVSSSNYKKILRGLDSSFLFFTNEVRPVTKKYEDMFLRQAISKDERSCVQGKKCECMFLDQSQPFVGVEFRLPWETSARETPGLCLPCSRAATQLVFFDLLQSGEKINGVIQRWYASQSSCARAHKAGLMFDTPQVQHSLCAG